MPNLHARAIRRAVELKGGKRPLAAHLGVSMTRLALWAEGLEPVPTDVFLKVVDVLCEPAGNPAPKEPSPASRPSPCSRP